MQNPVTRKRLGNGDKGAEGLFGNNEEADARQRKINFAGSLSQKGVTREPEFD